MRTLRPFSHNAAIVKASLERQAENLKLKFYLEDPKDEVEDSLEEGEWKTWPRADGLWKTTCFEFFLGKTGEESYWEFNFSPSRQAWNCYRFEGYRLPQPPISSQDFELVALKMTSDTFECTLKSKVETGQCEANLAAVVKTTRGVSFFALEHASAKPDFHLRKGFILGL